jgi:hypothetical protein
MPEHKRVADSEPREHHRTALDLRNWRLADVVIVATLLFNLGVMVTRLNTLERALQAAEVRIETLRDGLGAIRERMIRLEERGAAGPPTHGPGAP